MTTGKANVWLCHQCGRFEFTKPELDVERVHGLVCAWCNLEEELLPDQAIFEVQVRA